MVRDDGLAREVSTGRTDIDRSMLIDDFATAEPDQPLIEILGQLGRHVVPLAVRDEQQRLLGVLPRADVLVALTAVPSRS